MSTCVVCPISSSSRAGLVNEISCIALPTLVSTCVVCPICPSSDTDRRVIHRTEYFLISRCGSFVSVRSHYSSTLPRSTTNSPAGRIHSRSQTHLHKLKHPEAPPKRLISIETLFLVVGLGLESTHPTRSRMSGVRPIPKGVFSPHFGVI